jgi:hypothetical protein
VLAIAGVGALFVPHWAGIAAGAALLLAAVASGCSFWADRRRRQRTVRDLANQYRPIPPESWVSAAEQHARQQADYAAALERHRADRQLLEARLNALKQELDAATGGRSLQEATQFYTDAGMPMPPWRKSDGSTTGQRSWCRLWVLPSPRPAPRTSRTP